MIREIWERISEIREDLQDLRKIITTLWRRRVLTVAPLIGGGGEGEISLSLGASGVTPGSYTTASVTVDAYGRVTAASSGTAAGGGRLAIGLIPGAVGATFYPKPGEGYAAAPTPFYLHSTTAANRRITMASPIALGAGESATLQIKRFTQDMGAWEDVGSPVAMSVGARSVTTTFTAAQNYEYAFRWISDSAVIQDLHSWIEEA